MDKDNDDIEDKDLLGNMNKEELESREDENDNSLEGFESSEKIRMSPVLVLLISQLSFKVSLAPIKSL